MLNSKQKNISLIIFLSVLIFSIPAFVMARGLVPCGGDGEAPCGVSDIFVLLARVTNWLIMAASAYAVFQIVTAGFYLVVSMGNEETITKYRDMLTQAIFGLVFTLFAYVLVNTAVNLILLSKCKVDLKNPMSYLDIKTCTPNPVYQDLKK